MTESGIAQRGSLEHEDLTGRIIGAAIAVHMSLGPGFLESVYEMAMAIELKGRKIPFVRQERIEIRYRGEFVGRHRLDFFVAKEIVVELKAIKELEDIHFATVRSYLRAVDRKHGLLLNFATKPLCVKRVRTRQERHPPL